MQVDLQGLEENAGQFHIHELPVARVDVTNSQLLSSSMDQGSQACAQVGDHYYYKNEEGTWVCPGELNVDFGNILEGKRSVDETFTQKPQQQCLYKPPINGKPAMIGGLHLSGPHSIIGRSVLIHKNMGLRWVCATILEKDVDYRVVRAEFLDGIEGTVELIQDKKNQASRKADRQTDRQATDRHVARQAERQAGRETDR